MRHLPRVVTAMLVVAWVEVEKAVVQIHATVVEELVAVGTFVLERQPPRLVLDKHLMVLCE